MILLLWDISSRKLTAVPPFWVIAFPIISGPTRTGGGQAGLGTVWKVSP